MHIYHTPPPYLSRSSSGPSANPATSLDLAHRSRADRHLNASLNAMDDRSARRAKDDLYDAFASVAKALGNGRRAEIVEIDEWMTLQLPEDRAVVWRVG